MNYESMTNHELLRILPLTPDCTPLTTLLLNRLDAALHENDLAQSKIADYRFEMKIYG